MDILLAVNSKMFTFLLTLLYSVFKNNLDADITIWLCYAEMQEKELLILNKFIENFGGKLKKIYIKEELYKELNVDFFPKETYFRILALDLLPPELNKILYLDVDMICKGSLKKIYNMDVSDFAFAACEDIYGRLTGILEKKKQKLGIPQEYVYINTGMLLLNLEYFRKTEASKKIIDHLHNGMADYTFPDQDALNMLFYSNIKIVPWEYYNCPPMLYVYGFTEDGSKLLNCTQIRELEDFTIGNTVDFYKHAVIVHFAGTRRPWLEKNGEPVAVEIFRKCFEESAEGADRILECIL